MLWAVVVILLVLWLLGFLVAHIGGGLIHILLIIAVIAVLYNVFVSRRSASR
ncbi:MAG: lmo0937 family membrane protein [Candidatus Dormibacteraeota bacterium]|nr:lmo0937 family membrane protein [Candidatus Dormibacteraeota bacterium]